MNNKYTDEQVKDIEGREQKALQFLIEMELTPSAVLQAVNLGNDIFATKVIPFLKDTKFASKEETPKTTETVTEASSEDSSEATPDA